MLSFGVDGRSIFFSSSPTIFVEKGDGDGGIDGEDRLGCIEMVGKGMKLGRGKRNRRKEAAARDERAVMGEDE